MFKIIYKLYREKFYDELIQEFIGCVPVTDREPVLDFLAEKKVLFERFLSIQAYHIQRSRILSKKSTDFYDGALMIIKAFLVAVNKKVQSSPVFSVPKTDPNIETKNALENISQFLKNAIKKEDTV